MSGLAGSALSLGLNALIVKPERGIYDPTTGKLFPAIPIPQATIQELMHDDLEITDHPVEQGSSISDHAYKRPSELIVKAAWSNSPTNTGLSALANVALATAAAQANSAIGGAINLLSQVQGAVGLAGSLVSANNGSGQNQMKAILTALLKLQQADPTTKAIPLVNVYTGNRNYYNMVLKSISVENDWKTENALFATLTFKQIILVSVQVAIGPTAPAKPAVNAAPAQTALQKLSSTVKNFVNVPPITTVAKLL